VLVLLEQSWIYAYNSFQNDSKWWINEQWHKLFGNFSEKIQVKNWESFFFLDLDLSRNGMLSVFSVMINYMYQLLMNCVN
jgi:hypothetical protein